MGSGFSKKKKEAKLLKEQFEKMQTQLKNESATGTAGGGLISITLNGEYEILDLSIQPECVDPEDIEVLEDLVKAAFEDAVKKLHHSATSPMSGMPNLSAFGF
ncbi:MAG: YbaB/EbfC family nucleoid-associated protein [Chlamydiia bacterium]|nr:YbaB/EbfC family nucleoid-associated protein [Chlamydiia bacterium]